MVIMSACSDEKEAVIMPSGSAPHCLVGPLALLSGLHARWHRADKSSRGRCLLFLIFLDADVRFSR
jgi:hypothetical protein